MSRCFPSVFFFFNDTATTEIYTLSLHDALPILRAVPGLERAAMTRPGYAIEYDFYPPTQLTPWLETKPVEHLFFAGQDRKSTRLNSSHLVISYAVFCLKKKN